MIITNLIGGLGNQLFQFAAGFALAQRHGTELRVSVDQFDGYALHQGYEFERVFAASVQPASSKELASALGVMRSASSRRVMSYLARKQWLKPDFLGGRALFEASPNYWSGWEQAGAGVYLHGYWQSERYFSGVTPQLRAALRFRAPPSGENAHWIDRIQACPAVAVHVRRGDYATAKNRGLYAHCTPDYYRAAISQVLATEPDAEFFVFSDEPTWAKQMLSRPGVTMHVVEHNRGPESYNDMRLMSCCRHFIIANSTFSWWGAWLGEKLGSMVIGPPSWFNAPGRSVDVLPARWLQAVSISASQHVNAAEVRS
jgi:hypothetical protein